MHLDAKRPVLASPALWGPLAKLSKAALIDLVVDMLRRMEGADEDEAVLLRALATEYLPPVMRERGDRPPKELRP